MLPSYGFPLGPKLVPKQARERTPLMRISRMKMSGALFMLRSSFAFSIMALCVKWASQSVPSSQVVFFRSVFGVIAALIVIRQKRISLWGRQKRLMVIRGLCGFGALSLFFYALGILPLGTAVMLNYTSPIISGIFSVFILKERPSPLLILMTLLSFFGVYLLLDADLHGQMQAVLAGLLSAVFASLAYVTIRAVKYRESPLTIMFYFTAISTLGSSFFLSHEGFVWPPLTCWLALLGVGIGSFYGQLWLTIAFRRAPASLVSPLSYLTPLLSFLYGAVFLGSPVTTRNSIGAMLIILAGTLISGFETRARKLTARKN